MESNFAREVEQFKFNNPELYLSLQSVSVEIAFCLLLA